MATADPDPADRTNDALDALVDAARGHDPDRSTNDAVDPALAETVRRLRALDSAGTPDTYLTNRIWEDLMSQSAVAATLSQPRSRRSLPSPNGRVSTPSQWATARRTAETRRGWAIPQILLAALLLLSLGGGYLALRPIGSGPDRPQSIPAMVAPGGTPNAAASPTATLVPMDGHSLIGSWSMLGAWQTASDPNRDVWSFGDNGKFGSFETFASRVCVGTWQPTGERTADLVFILQGVTPQDLFDPDHVAGQLEVGPRIEVWRLSVTVDETGNTMTVDGTWKAVMNGVPEAGEELVQLTGARMAPVPTTSATPAP